MELFKPLSTYRIQFNKGFNFISLKQIIPYLKSLGVETIYASPIFRAMPGSTHGYDVTDPLTINPEIGTEKQLFALSAKLKAAGISWLQDIVPNHMAFHPDNKWLMDVLEKGRTSEFVSFFDINIGGSEKLMVPFLGDSLEKVIAAQAFQIKKTANDYKLNFGGNNWPINKEGQEFISNNGLGNINKNSEHIAQLVEMQHYRPCSWQETDSVINYRRFFTVNSLICLNIQNQETFDAYHHYIFKLVEKGVFQGLRVDHIDGLADPKAYLDRLRKGVGEQVYVVVEKILARDEQMPANWDTQGTTGYDFLAMSNNLFTNKEAKKPFDQIYQKVTGKELDPEALIHEKKSAILYGHMEGELDNLVTLFLDLNLAEKDQLNRVGKTALKQAIGEMLILMPVYRYYEYDFPLSGKEREQLSRLLKAVSENPAYHQAGELLSEVFLCLPHKKDKGYQLKLRRFYQRCMQFTGPLMAKGVEDTVMFTYNRFTGHNEVGDSPEAFGLQVKNFHQQMIERQLYWPFSMNAGATHDTKRGEDTRARLNVLTDIPKRWADVVAQLFKLSRALQQEIPEFKTLHQNDIYLFFQTVFGALTLPGEDEDELKPRLSAYLEKALREAKKRSGWDEPDEDYENKLKHFAEFFIGPATLGYQVLSTFLAEIADFTIINSLSQLLLKFTCPGIPDVYQGTELYDLSLVDPDNRRPVDYEKRAGFLAELDHLSPKKLWEERNSGMIKLWLTSKLLKIRRDNRTVFENGVYIPLEVTGKYQKNICAYARQIDHQWIVVVIPLGLAALNYGNRIDQFDWKDTEVILPENAPQTWINLLDDEISAKDILRQGIGIGQVFTGFALAILSLTKRTEERASGILMHITSLASAFGIGDLGREADRFVDFLSGGKQKYWQILPLNPTKSENGHSPYSSNSAMAGNFLLISAEQLMADGLLVEAELEEARLPANSHIDFKAVEKSKIKLLHRAYRRFQKDEKSQMQQDYEAFCNREKEWLDTFVLYVGIKKHHGGLEWYHWPEGFKRRQPKQLAAFIKDESAALEEIKWQQFIFYRQWTRLKTYANKLGVSIIGDLPFYLDLDSVEVWCHPEFFELDNNLLPEKVGGVPPDYFNDKGQRWGMPVYNWDAMKADGYQWWINRLRKNMELFDLLRLDHFRAFYAYWEIPAADIDATGGRWVKVDGTGFFKALKKALGNLPFIAEDLGEASAGVDALRETFGFPGMKVLQFSFGEDMLASTNIIHNFKTSNCIAYSGTHDNNTLKGWFENELGTEGEKRLGLYAGQKVTANNVHQVVARLVHASVAKIAILTVQDVLGLGEEARMNIPGQTEGNWTWRLGSSDLDKAIADGLKLLTEIYGRGN